MGKHLNTQMKHDERDLIYKVTNTSTVEFKNDELCQIYSTYLRRGTFSRVRNSFNMNCM